MDMHLELEDPSDWPDTLPRLRELDQLLRCPVCKEYFGTAMVTTSCGHTFCSLCVRRCLAQETRCPSCRVSLTESELHPNRLIDSIVHTFKNGRPQLLDALKDKADSAERSKQRAALKPKQGCVHERRMQEMDASQKRRRIGTRNAGISDNRVAHTSAVASSPVVELTSSDVELMANSDDDSDFMPDKISSPTRTRPATKLQSSVPCPNCQEPVRQARINWHLDRCLSGRPTRDTLAAGALPALGLQAAPAAHSALPRPTKLAYSLFSEAKLRRTLKDLGIPTKGDKQQMQARHVEWVNLYMANADSLTPVSHRLLLRRLAAWEESLAKPPADGTVKLAPASEGDVAEHAAKYADSFAALVTLANATRAKPTTVVSDSASDSLLSPP
ncbi:E3 ubiquitin-protein ligase rad18 [Coemansia thaxteri]|uniref:Postreplication repair E3 ubiquitin-protein ligase RAD18 n=1 Tax=Coemansia thaxteri TaxID=2663907 RepID=A0A9W8BLC4_9FUNG|nr:E3 ubiquitin-protein ligase rad18 [Coemansia thaxteri]KAJ2004911.1 E3 ubiquitin-protein ligase rad18 [Coemansia thaxteri]KAJ2470018.1 E3 ubiquitin-protein ligase rad18 [Coemansia sp. RSA 2322]KAJ2485090.1 E3 ubiquitin-protein ligase rad18 [Coemansia sp. RSA 2320]